MQFCKEFNAKTAGRGHDHPRRHHGRIPTARSASSCRRRRTSVLLKKAAGLPTSKKPGAGSKEPNKTKVGKVTKAQVVELAKQKIQRHELRDARGGHPDRSRGQRARWGSTSSRSDARDPPRRELTARAEESAAERFEGPNGSGLRLQSRKPPHHHPGKEHPGESDETPGGRPELTRSRSPRRTMPKLPKNRVKADALVDRAKKFSVDEA